MVFFVIMIIVFLYVVSIFALYILYPHNVNNKLYYKILHLTDLKMYQQR